MTDINIKYIPIETITRIKTINYTQMTIKIINHNIGDNQAEINVNVLDNTLENVKIFTYLIDGINYLNWSTDNFLLNYVKNKLSQEKF